MRRTIGLLGLLLSLGCARALAQTSQGGSVMWPVGDAGPSAYLQVPVMLSQGVTNAVSQPIPLYQQDRLFVTCTASTTVPVNMLGSVDLSLSADGNPPWVDAGAFSVSALDGGSQTFAWDITTGAQVGQLSYSEVADGGTFLCRRYVKGSAGGSP